MNHGLLFGTRRVAEVKRDAEEYHFLFESFSELALRNPYSKSLKSMGLKIPVTVAFDTSWFSPEDNPERGRRWHLAIGKTANLDTDWQFLLLEAKRQRGKEVVEIGLRTQDINEVVELLNSKVQERQDHNFVSEDGEWLPITVSTFMRYIATLER